jgi:hypothetical protein
VNATSAPCSASSRLNSVGNIPDLRGRITLARQQIGQLKEQVSAFRVVPEYERRAAEADSISGRVTDLVNQAKIDRANLGDLRRSVSEMADVSTEYLEPAFAE